MRPVCGDGCLCWHDCSASCCRLVLTRGSGLGLAILLLPFLLNPPLLAGSSVNDSTDRPGEMEPGLDGGPPDVDSISSSVRLLKEPPPPCAETGKVWL